MEKAKMREAASAAVADALGDAYDCTRVWSAWGVGTMGPDDFHLVAADDSRLAEITEAALVPAVAIIDAQAAEVAAIRAAMGDLIRAYVGLLEIGRDRIIEAGGECDAVDVMENSDPWLRKARAALAQHQGEAHA